MNPETLKTFKVAVYLCLVCSVVVSTFAVGLQDIQDRQKEAFRQQSILQAAGLWDDDADREELWKLITPVVINMDEKAPTDKFDDEDGSPEVPELDAMLRDPQFFDVLPPADDVAGLKKREEYSVVYQIRENDRVKTVVLPIRGKGLWSTLYGFIALDLTRAEEGPTEITVAGLTYYRHGETPGLGGEVDNPRWKQKWPGKLVYDQDWAVEVEVAKNAGTDYQVDALSGATLTSNGVTNMLKFWLGEQGFGPYLQSLASPSKTAQRNSGTQL